MFYHYLIQEPEGMEKERWSAPPEAEYEIITQPATEALSILAWSTLKNRF